MRATDGGKSPGPPQQQNRKLWDRLIATVVAENTQPAPSQDAARKLIKYLSNPQTVDIVYEKLIERVNASKTQSQQVVPLTVKLLKTNLTQHVPSKETLHKLDMFCIALKSDSPIVSKSIQFVRNLIKKELSPLSKLGGSGGSESKPLSVVSGSSGKMEALNNPKSPVVEKHASHGHGHSTPVKSRNNGTLASREGDVDTIKGTGADGNKHLTGSGSPDHHAIKGIGGDRDRARDNSQELIADFLALNASQCDATLPIEDVSLATTSVFGSQLRRLSTSAGVKGSDVSDDLRIHDSETVRNHIKIVSMAKKQEEEQLYKQAGLVTLRRKGVQLFQYIYYKDQLPLSLPPEEMEQVVNSVVSSPQEDHESCLIASKILIKLLVDMYCSDGDAASRLLLSLLFEMLESSQTHTKVHAFNLLWNLSIHMNLLEEIATLPEEGGEGGGRETDAYKRIQAIQEDLFAVVWSAALNCALFFITNQGRLDKAKLGSLDPRILPTIITSIETLSDEMYRQLMRCFVNMLYTDKQELNVKLLLRACPGGISWIIRHYVRCRSDVVRGNLFTVIFHYILYKIKRTKKQKAAMILQLLASVHAPLYFTQLFRSPPPNFVKDFMTFMHDQLQIAPSFAPPANTPSHASPASSASSAASSASSSAANSTTTTPPNTPHQSAQHTPPPSPSTSFSSSYTPLLASTPREQRVGVAVGQRGGHRVGGQRVGGRVGRVAGVVVGRDGPSQHPLGGRHLQARRDQAPRDGPRRLPQARHRPPQAGAGVRRQGARDHQTGLASIGPLAHPGPVGAAAFSVGGGELAGRAVAVRAAAAEHGHAQGRHVGAAAGARAGPLPRPPRLRQPARAAHLLLRHRTPPPLPQGPVAGAHEGDGPHGGVQAPQRQLRAGRGVGGEGRDQPPLRARRPLQRHHLPHRYGGIVVVVVVVERGDVPRQGRGPVRRVPVRPHLHRPPAPQAGRHQHPRLPLRPPPQVEPHQFDQRRQGDDAGDDHPQVHQGERGPRSHRRRLVLQEAPRRDQPPDRLPCVAVHHRAAATGAAGAVPGHIQAAAAAGAGDQGRQAALQLLPPGHLHHRDEHRPQQGPRHRPPDRPRTTSRSARHRAGHTVVSLGARHPHTERLTRTRHDTRVACGDCTAEKQSKQACARTLLGVLFFSVLSLSLVPRVMPGVDQRRKGKRHGIRACGELS